MAGEEIDATLGVKLGFSTLASAGLGNLVSDVAGIGFAEQLEVRRGLSSVSVMCIRCILCLNNRHCLFIIWMSCAKELDEAL